MGYIKHHAIVVVGHQWDDGTTYENSDIRDAHAAAVDAGCIVTPLTEGAINTYWSFMVAPDGSKEGWDTSNDGDTARDQFVAWLRKHSTPGEGWFGWSEVVIGSDDHECHIERHAWDSESGNE